MIESIDQSEVCSGRCHVDVATRLIRFRFESKPETIFLVERVFAKIIDGLAQAFDRFIGTAASIGLRTFTAAPEDKYLCLEFAPSPWRAESFARHMRGLTDRSK